LISFSVLDQPEHGDCVVSRGFQAFPDKGTAGIGAFSCHGSELFEPFVEKPLAMIDRRVSARSVSF
jgi:hypothetical protein